MPRRPRIALPGVPLHVIQRGNNRQAIFFAEEDYRYFLGQLAECARSAGCSVHAYVLMTNHFHLLLTPGEAGSAGRLMKQLGQRYVQRVNRSYRRSGSLWEGRFRSCIIQDAAYLMACSRYVELNPVRAGMVAQPADYPWSSYRANAHGERDPAVTPHSVYMGLADDGPGQRAAYRDLFRYTLKLGQLDEIRRATNGNFALGDPRFQAQIAAALGRRVTPGKPGRPRKESGPQPEETF